MIQQDTSHHDFASGPDFVVRQRNRGGTGPELRVWASRFSMIRVLRDPPSFAQDTWGSWMFQIPSGA
jgi:hypothetical protein